MTFLIPYPFGGHYSELTLPGRPRSSLRATDQGPGPRWRLAGAQIAAGGAGEKATASIRVSSISVSRGEVIREINVGTAKIALICSILITIQPIKQNAATL